MSLAKQTHCLCISLDVKFADHEFLWCAINMINIDCLWLAFGQASATANVHMHVNQNWFFSRNSVLQHSAAVLLVVLFSNTGLVIARYILFFGIFA